MVNNCILKSNSKRLITYCGGISAYSYYRVIDNHNMCGWNDQVEVEEIV